MNPLRASREYSEWNQTGEVVNCFKIGQLEAFAHQAGCCEVLRSVCLRIKRARTKMQVAAVAIVWLQGVGDVFRL